MCIGRDVGLGVGAGQHLTTFFLRVKTGGDGKGRGRQGEGTAGFWVSNLGQG